MRKMLLICAAALGVAGITSAATSANIVGYQKVRALGSFSTGPTFIKVGHLADPVNVPAAWYLGDIKAEGMIPGIDYIQFLDIVGARVVVEATYVDAATALEAEDPELEGWWLLDDIQSGDLDPENKIDTESFLAWQAFLCNFENDVNLVYAGEVITGSQTNDFSDISSPFIANFLPIDLTLGQLVCEGMEPGIDYIQFLDVAGARVVVEATYVDAATALEAEDSELEGWWLLDDIQSGDLDPENKIDSYALPAGSAFLGNFSNDRIKIIFPDPLSL